MPQPVAIIYSDEYTKHDTGAHVECPERAPAIRRALMAAPCSDQLQWLDPRAATVDQIALIHGMEYIDTVRHACSRTARIAFLNPDTAISQRSYDVALLAAGGVLEGIDHVLARDVSHFFAVVRPPGHHAEHDESLGFCLFNNIAIGARYAIEHHHLERIFILDWDVHHGNGTQHSLDEDSQVFFCSFHQYPHYPGTGRVTETGNGAGKGYTLNFPMPAYSSHEDYIYLMQNVVVPAMEKFRPQLVLVSAGFDAHADDPLSNIKLTEETYAGMTHLMRRAAGPDVPLGLVLEGGYNLDALARSASAAVCALVDDVADVLSPSSPSRNALHLKAQHLGAHPFFVG